MSESRRNKRANEEPSAAESRRVLERVDRETESIGRSSGARIGQRMADHFAGRDGKGGDPQAETDPAEIWGKRIGRALAVPFFVFLIVWLGFTLGWW